MAYQKTEKYSYVRHGPFIEGNYYGPRNDKFYAVLKKVFTDARLEEPIIELLMSDRAKELFNTAFTSETVNEKNNYQNLEQLGDVSVNKFIVGYLYRRFPGLWRTAGVGVVSPMKAYLVSEDELWKLADNFGFWPYISVNNDKRYFAKEKLLEDVFEAFIGAVEWLINEKCKADIGYPVVSLILRHIYDNRAFEFKYENIIDSKTLLKQIFDRNKDKGVLKYQKGAYNDKTRLVTYHVYLIGNNGRSMLLGSGEAYKKEKAEKIAARRAIDTVKARLGLHIDIPSRYNFLKDL